MLPGRARFCAGTLTDRSVRHTGPAGGKGGIPMEAIPQSGQAPSLPRLGMPAPPFQAETTHGTLRLEDFKGSWLILFSHPADFTPVCTTEFIEFAKIAPDLRRRGVELLG